MTRSLLPGSRDRDRIRAAFEKDLKEVKVEWPTKLNDVGGGKIR